MPIEEVIVSVITSSIISLFMLLLGFLYSIKLKSLYYEIERKTKLLEKCYGPLKNYFTMVGILDSPEIAIKARLDVWEGIKNIYLTYLLLNT